MLVSGAADGIGLACAAAFAECGAQLILCDSDGTALTRAADGLGAFSRYCDVISEASVAVFAAEIDATLPSIDVLINAAGKAYVRSLGMMQMSRALLPIIRRGRGRRLIVNIEPAEGFASSGIFPYAGSSEAFRRLSEALADQVRGSSIGIVSIAPDIRSETSGGRCSEQLRRLQRIDATATAARIANLVAEARPGWRQREVRRSRRA